jgi:uncharacterized protein (TIGR02246 family)
MSDQETTVADGGAGPVRPVLHRASETASAEAVVTRLVERLQAGLDRGDADYYDGAFSEDVLWGSPYGQVLTGYSPLNAAHHSMMDVPTLGRSRYEVVQVSKPVDDVVLAHVRRRSLASAPTGGGPDFEEMALYVLVHRDGEWWLAAGQNTPIRDKS